MGLSHHRDSNNLLWIEFTPEGRRPPILTSAVLETLDERIRTAETDPPAGLIFSGEPGGDFQAGVDLDEMASLRTQQDSFREIRIVQLLFQRLAALSMPTVAAIEGRCIGGGTELALACTARIAADDPATALALPEVHIGIIPGFGGTQRLPRLIGQRRALNMILTGQAVDARTALSWGLVDRLVEPGGLREQADRLVRDLQTGRFRARGPNLWWRPWELVFEGFGFGRRAVRRRYRTAVRTRTGGHFPAPESAIDIVGLAADRMPMAEGLEREADADAELMAGPVHRQLLRLMRARQALRRPRGSYSDAGLSETVDHAVDFHPPEALRDAVESAFRELQHEAAADAEPGEVPMVDTAEGIGLLRRLPVGRPPVAAEVTWFPAAGGPPGFGDIARRLLSAAGITPVFCYLAEPSPGINLVGAYLREGDRLVAEGWEPEHIDATLRDWGMSRGPFEFARRLGPGWERRWRSVATRIPPDELPTAASDQLPEEDVDPEARLIEEVVSVLVLEMSRLWELVSEPTDAGWAVLDVFALGGPAFRGGVLGAARKMGLKRIRAHLGRLSRRWGPLYAPDSLDERGLPGKDGES
jgi:enoyl-CoA hydratase/carnithine racemase